MSMSPKAKKFLFNNIILPILILAALFYFANSDDDNEEGKDKDSKQVKMQNK